MLALPGALFEAGRGGVGEADLLQAAALLRARTTDCPRDAETAEDILEEASALLRRVVESGGATRHALSVLKRGERGATPQETAGRAWQLWEAEHR